MKKAEPLPLLKQGATAADLAESDVELSALYKSLAKRHDALVDWINKQLSR